MASFLAGRGLKAQALGDALAGWSANAKEAATSTIAVMFTDMVSSVQTTQKLGDEGAMRLVQTHNLIIGSVLKTHRGHQVKHTGDGIMAVFPRVVDGVAAAAEMQRQIDEHNRISMSHPLSVRIGLSAGEPVREDNDYFGTVVQLSARVCAVADAREVAVSDLVAELAGSEIFVFSDIQRIPLKGFAEPQPVRMLLWEQKPSAEPNAPRPAPIRRPPPVAQQLPPGHGGLVN
jgi:adenylate cyclase